MCIFVQYNVDFQYEMTVNKDETPVFLIQFHLKLLTQRGRTPSNCTQQNQKNDLLQLFCLAIVQAKCFHQWSYIKGKLNDVFKEYMQELALLCHTKKKPESIKRKFEMDKRCMVYKESKPALLFLDKFSAHLTQKVKEMFDRHNTTIVDIL